MGKDLFDQLLKEAHPQAASLGRTAGGQDLFWRLSRPTEHILIIGAPNSGKTALIQSMALSPILNNQSNVVQMAFIDIRRNIRSFYLASRFNDIPHLFHPIVSDIHQAIFILGEMVEEVVRRDRENISEPKFIILINEVTNLVDQGGKAFDHLLTRLTGRGGRRGIHIVASTQETQLAADLGKRFPVRLMACTHETICLSLLNNSFRKIAGDSIKDRAADFPEEWKLGNFPHCDADEIYIKELIRPERGDFLLFVEDYAFRFQSACVADEDLSSYLRAVSNPTTTRKYDGNAASAELDHLRKLLSTYQKNLQRVEQQIADHGGNMDAPLKLLNQRESLQGEVDKIGAKIYELEKL